MIISLGYRIKNRAETIKRQETRFSKSICYIKHLHLLLLATIVALCSCGGQDPKLQTGDLVFVKIPADYNRDSEQMSSAIAAATGNDDAGLHCIHVAILELQKDSVWVIDATTKRGVDRHPLDTFLLDFTLKNGSLPVLEVMRLKEDSRAKEFVQNTKKYLGLPYDLHFLPDNGAMYCSELVHDSYRIPDKGSVFSSAPMNFKNRDGEFPFYWTQLFERLGQKIPQDIEGTNPEAMSKEDVLRPINVDLVSYSLQRVLEQ